MSAKRYRIVATCFDKKGKVLGVGKNSYTKSHPLAFHFAKLAENNTEKCYLHAELDSLLKARGKPVHSIYVQRIEKEGFGLAKPCKACACAIKAFGVKFVQYTTNDERIEQYEVL